MLYQKDFTVLVALRSPDKGFQVLHTDRRTSQMLIKFYAAGLLQPSHFAIGLPALSLQDYSHFLSAPDHLGKLIPVHGSFVRRKFVTSKINVVSGFYNEVDRVKINMIMNRLVHQALNSYSTKFCSFGVSHRYASIR